MKYGEPLVYMLRYRVMIVMAFAMGQTGVYNLTFIG